MTYVIRIGRKKDGRIEWYYYNGNTYKKDGQCFVEELFVTLDKAKRYSTKDAAEKAGDKLHDKCSNVNLWFVEEINE